MTNVSQTLGSRLKGLGRAALGSRSDWLTGRPDVSAPRLGVHLLGPLAIVASTLLPWFAFAGAEGEDGSVAFGLFIGAASITLMSWSFLLAVRFSALEPFFAGLDSMYRTHRWVGSLAVVAMFLHLRVESEIEGGVLGASESLADTARGLASVSEYLLYSLVGVSILRWFPYRYWRWTHKLLGVPFVFAALHFFTAEKPYANGSAWGWYFGIVMVVGLASWVLRVVWRDMVRPGLPYTVESATRSGNTTELVLVPVQRRLEHAVGQFAVVKLDMETMREPHVFSIASPPNSEILRFYVRNLGDWTGRFQDLDLSGANVVVEGPYGRFDPMGDSARRIVWVAGGVGITPFLSATEALPSEGGSSTPTLIYCVHSEADATALGALRDADRDGRIHLEVFESGKGRRFTAEEFSSVVGGDLSGAHVAVCGPAGLVTDVKRAAENLGADHVETERFDLRSGFGPDLSVQIGELIHDRADVGTD